jgi:hypothetical protein
METFILKIEDYDQTTELNQFLATNLTKIISTTNIIEYDIQIVEDKSVLFKLVDDHYLLLNKIYMKEFYMYWRKCLLSNETNQIDDMITLCVLLINPNMATAWSKRKSLLVSNLTDLNFELELNHLILIKHVKCECAYIQRRWLVKKLKNYQDFLFKEIEFFFETLCFKVKANYYCWSYLNWIIFYALENNNFLSLDQVKYIFIYFFNKLKDFIYLNPSDNCLFHTRLNILTSLNNLNCLFYLNDDYSQLVLNEIELFDDLLIRYSNMTTMWNYLKYFQLFLVKISQNIKFDLNCLNDLNKNIIEKLNCNENIFDSIRNETIWVYFIAKRYIIITENLKADKKITQNFSCFLNKFLKFYCFILF